MAKIEQTTGKPAKSENLERYYGEIACKGVLGAARLVAGQRSGQKTGQCASKGFASQMSKRPA